MSMKEGLIEGLKSSKEFFDRSTRCLVEADAEFRPKDEMFTVRQQVAHVAHTIDWFIDGAFRPEGFSMDFENHVQELDSGASTLAEARAWYDRAMQRAIATIQEKSDADLMAPLPPGLVMGGEPRLTALHAIIEHSAHHRGALTVYSRLIGHVPAMPYMDM